MCIHCRYIHSHIHIYKCKYTNRDKFTLTQLEAQRLAKTHPADLWVPAVCPQVAIPACMLPILWHLQHMSQTDGRMCHCTRLYLQISGVRQVTRQLYPLRPMPHRQEMTTANPLHQSRGTLYLSCHIWKENDCTMRKWTINWRDYNSVLVVKGEACDF